MAVPPTLAVPAAVTVAAYLNARFSIFYDQQLLFAILPTVIGAYWREYRGRMSLFYTFQSLATSKSSAQRLFLRFEEKTWTYAQAYDLVLRYASWLEKHHGVKSGDIVALDYQNHSNQVFFILALWCLGAKPALLNFNLTGRPLEHCIRRASTRLIIVEPAVAGKIDDDLRAKLIGVVFDIFTPEREVDVCNSAPISTAELKNSVRGEEMAALIYTSGTTGLPKAAIVSWAKLVIVGEFTARWIGTKATDVFYSAMPLYHATAVIMGFSHTLSRGATFALGRKFSTSQFWPDVRRHDATIVQYVGEALRYLVNAPPNVDPKTGEIIDKKHKVRMAFGNGLRPDIWKRFQDRFGVETIAEFYAATEGSFGTWNLSRNDFGVGAVGRNGSLYNQVMGRNLAIVELDLEKDEPWRDPKTGFCRRVKAGEPGELMFQLPPNNINARFQGYYGDEEATSKKIWRNVFSKGDVWFRTGDIVRRSSDNLLYFSDRIGDTFRWKSENVSTAEVAEIIGLHPSVRELNVYGVEVPHHEGRAGCAAVVFDPSALEASNRAPRPDVLKSLANHARKGLPKYALPLFLRVVAGSGLATTGTHKHPKNVLRDQGIAPEKTVPDEIYWLRGDTYVRLDPQGWDELRVGRVRL